MARKSKPASNTPSHNAAAIFKALTPIVSDDSHRGAIRFVHVERIAATESAPGIVRITATDGHALVSVRVPPRLLPDDLAPGLYDAKKSAALLALDAVPSPSQDGAGLSFPHIEQVIPADTENNTATCAVNPVLFSTTLDAMSKIAAAFNGGSIHTPAVRVVCTGHLSPLALRHTSADGAVSVVGVVMPMRV